MDKEEVKIVQLVAAQKGFEVLGTITGHEGVYDSAPVIAWALGSDGYVYPVTTEHRSITEWDLQDNIPIRHNKERVYTYDRNFEDASEWLAHANLIRKEFGL